MRIQIILLSLLQLVTTSTSSGLKLSNDDPGRICAMSNDKTEPSKVDLTFWYDGIARFPLFSVVQLCILTCNPFFALSLSSTEFAESSCCSINEENQLVADFDRYWRAAAGHCPGCLANVKAFQCGYTCGPNQADFVDVKRNGNGTVVQASIRMCNAFCSSFYSSCGNITVAQMEANNANAFCQGFVSD